MPKTAKKKKESNLEFQKRTFPKRVAAQRAKNEEVLRVSRGGLGPVTVAQKKAATKSERALNRVEARLDIKPKPKKAETKRAELIRKKKKVLKNRGDALRKILEIQALIRKAPGVGKRNLQEVRRISGN